MKLFFSTLLVVIISAIGMVSCNDDDELKDKVIEVIMSEWTGDRLRSQANAVVNGSQSPVHLSMDRKRHLQQAQGVDGGFCFSLADTGKNQWNCDPMTNPLLSTPLHSLPGEGWWPRGEDGERRNSSGGNREQNPLCIPFRLNKTLHGCSLHHCRRR